MHQKCSKIRGKAIVSRSHPEQLLETEAAVAPKQFIVNVRKEN